MSKVVRHGNVAVIVAPECRGGWYTRNTESNWDFYRGNGENVDMLFDPEVVELVMSLQSRYYDDDEEKDVFRQIMEIERRKWPSGFEKSNHKEYPSELDIEWLPEGSQFVIGQYDGEEFIMLKNSDSWHSTDIDCPKVVRDGKVAVAIKPGYGGNYIEDQKIRFDPDIIELIEQGKLGDLKNVAVRKGFINDYERLDNMMIQWLPVGFKYHIFNYDGSESLFLEEDLDWITA